jgi:hypothetical protein
LLPPVLSFDLYFLREKSAQEIFGALLQAAKTGKKDNLDSVWDDFLSHFGIALLPESFSSFLFAVPT